MRKLSTTIGFLLLGVLGISGSPATAQPNKPVTTTAAAPDFELKSGDRVVFLGNSLFENDLPYGYLELALTTRWPNQQVTFRNIAWTGDTVWGEARSYISSPGAYDLLKEQLTNARPTVVFIAYGAIEAQAGEEGIEHFTEGLQKLLDHLNQLGAKAVLLSPMPVFSYLPPAQTGPKNAMLAHYAAAIAQTAAARNHLYLDIYHPLLEQSQKVKLSDNGLHLNETGYYYLATLLENQLGLPPRPGTVTLDLRHPAANTPLITILPTGPTKGTYTITRKEGYLPLPLPAASENNKLETPLLKVVGLKKGFYTLTANGAEVITASADKWKNGVEIKSGAAYEQACQLRDLIIKKNELFFQQYRPQNRTYILGFRAHEQGRHAQGLEELSTIISWLEGQISLKRAPQPVVYQLSPIK